MYCVIQEVELKKENIYGEYKELEAYYTSWVIDGVEGGIYGYRYAGDRFKRPIKKAYKISIHKSYRENGKVKKKQWVICTMRYYAIASTCGSWIGDYCNLDKKCEVIGITEDELCKLVYEKLDPLVEKIEKEYQQTEEYKTHEKHRKIIDKYLEDKSKFEKIYGSNSYDKCYDVFGTLRNSELLESIKRQYESTKEYQRSYYENFNSNYNSYNSYGGYSNNKQSNHNEEDKDKYKKIYKTLAKAYHPDIVKDDGEMMKIVNQLKEEWGI
ncbi:hypothetical protein [Clostridium sp.]|uniref:hypothetical protein n=1 Tax=Clostridium sp. TaxID=1506 RepID=UPI0029102713|nr:hypothetical protein [Clostridium sp.]MDU4724849.1 hypothetical protein [Clostridium sp.]